MNYDETIEYIHSTPKFARVLGNTLLRRLLSKMDNPQKKLKFIHIAGTNGKGSCAVMLAEILKLCGLRTGLFTSPYIIRFNERIRVNGEQIPDARLAETASEIKNIIDENNVPVSEFALDTAIAFKYFADEKCDIVILETGLGGRLDATNVIASPIVSIIMSVGFDHMQYLGNTISAITTEKCGIIKNNRPVVVYPDLPDEALAVIKHFCKNRNAEFIQADMPIKSQNGLVYKDKKYELSLGGEFQIYNAAVVIETADRLNRLGFFVPESAVRKGLKLAKNPARFERLDCGLIIDGAHNKPAAAALCKSLKTLGKPVYLCIAMMGDKDIASCAEELSKLNPIVTVTEIPMPRCAKAETLANEFLKHNVKVRIEKNCLTAAKDVLKTSQGSGIAVVCGSLYFAAEIRKVFKNETEI